VGNVRTAKGNEANPFSVYGLSDLVCVTIATIFSTAATYLCLRHYRRLRGRGLLSAAADAHYRAHLLILRFCLPPLAGCWWCHGHRGRRRGLQRLGPSFYRARAILPGRQLARLYRSARHLRLRLPATPRPATPAVCSAAGVGPVSLLALEYVSPLFQLGPLDGDKDATILIASVALLARCAIRIAELSKGYHGPIWHNKVDYVYGPLEGSHAWWRYISLRR